MKCPIDNTTLLITDRQNIEIDYCPECRGVWLDRGELDKIISAESPRGENSSYARPPESRRQHGDDYYNGNHGNGGHGGDYRKQKRGRESFLGNLFDF